MVQEYIEKIKYLSQTIHKSPKIHQCPQHNLPSQYICLHQNCKQYMHQKCKECDHKHQRMNVKKILPQLSQWLVSTWEHISEENAKIENQWKICQVNINYCFDILREVQKLIQSRKVHEMPTFRHLLQSVLQMTKAYSIEGMLNIFQKLNANYGIFTGEKPQCQALDDERQFRFKKWKKMGLKTKAFSQKALAFSQTLAQTVEQKIKHQKRMKQLEEITSNKILALKDIMKHNLEEVKDLKIELSSSHEKREESEQNIEEYLEKCQNLKTLYINNKNGLIIHKTWNLITNKLQYLNRLRQLKLNLRIQDVRFLTKLFKQKPNSIRHVQILHLTITDEPKLDVREVAQFCNTLQLRQLSLTLTRDNITKKGFEHLVKDLRKQTSLSSLPLNSFCLNVKKNKIIDKKQIIDCEQFFSAKCHQIKKKSLEI